MKDKKYPTGVESHGGFLRYSQACDTGKYAR